MKAKNTERMMEKKEDRNNSSRVLNCMGKKEEE